MNHECFVEKETLIFVHDQVNGKDQVNLFCVLPVEGRALALDADLAAT